MVDIFSEHELNHLQARARNASNRAEVGDKEINPDIRRSNVEWLHNIPENAWVFEKLAHVAGWINARYYHFDLTGFGEGLQLTHYDQSDHGMYGWHQDFNGNISRKLSLVLQLSDPSEYEGGNLEISAGAGAIAVRKQRGLVAAFPSFSLHQVTPVVRGTRQSLVAWVSGPTFK
jgi:PKHD-type hydroxylase